MESAACGLLAARSIWARLTGRDWAPPPQTTMCGALLGYITTPNKDFQPMGGEHGHPARPPRHPGQARPLRRFVRDRAGGDEEVGGGLNQGVSEAAKSAGRSAECGAVRASSAADTAAYSRPRG